MLPESQVTNVEETEKLDIEQIHRHIERTRQAIKNMDQDELSTIRQEWISLFDELYAGDGRELAKAYQSLYEMVTRLKSVSYVARYKTMDALTFLDLFKRYYMDPVISDLGKVQNSRFTNFEDALSKTIGSLKDEEIIPNQ